MGKSKCNPILISRLPFDMQNYTHTKDRNAIPGGSITTETTAELSIHSSFNSSDSFSDLQPRLTRPMSTGNLMEIASQKHTRHRLTVRFEDEQQSTCRTWAESIVDMAPTLPRSRSNEDFDNRNMHSDSMKGSIRKSYNSAVDLDVSPRKSKQELSLATQKTLWFHQSTSNDVSGLTTQNAVWTAPTRFPTNTNRLTVQALASPTSNRRSIDIRRSRRSSSSDRKRQSRRRNNTSSDSIQDLLKRL